MAADASLMTQLGQAPDSASVQDACAVGRDSLQWLAVNSSYAWVPFFAALALIWLQAAAVVLVYLFVLVASGALARRHRV